MRILRSYTEIINNATTREIQALDEATKSRIFTIMAMERRLLHNLALVSDHTSELEKRNAANELYDSLIPRPAGERHLYTFLDNLSGAEKEAIKLLFQNILYDQDEGLFRIITLWD